MTDKKLEHMTDQELDRELKHLTDKDLEQLGLVAEIEREQFNRLTDVQKKFFISLSRIPPEEFREDGRIFKCRRNSTEHECRDEKTGELLYYIRFD